MPQIVGTHFKHFQGPSNDHWWRQRVQERDRDGCVADEERADLDRDQRQRDAVLHGRHLAPLQVPLLQQRHRSRSSHCRIRSVK